MAKRICRALDAEGITYFIDLKGIGGGMEFPAVLAQAILDCRLFLYLASENSYQSKFTNSEITFAFNELPRESILPYIIDGSTLPVTMRFIFSGINWRTMSEHPIETVLVDDLLSLLGRNRKSEVPDYDDDYDDYDDDDDYDDFSDGYDVVLMSFGYSKLMVVKTVKELLGTGLAEAKALVDAAPQYVKKGLSWDEASEFKRYLEEAGAHVEIVASPS